MSIEFGKLVMNEREFIDTVKRGLDLRAVLNELRVEALRLKSEDDARWKQHEPILQAMRDNPCEATARAYTKHLDWLNSMKTYEQRGAIDDRRSKALKELRGVTSHVCKMLGIGWTEDDRSTP